MAVTPQKKKGFEVDFFPEASATGQTANTPWREHGFNGSLKVGTFSDYHLA